MNVITSIRYAAANPCQAITAAPSSGPAVKPRLNAAWLSVFAAGSSSGRISRGMIADRAGLFTAKNADWQATTAYRTHTWFQCNCDCSTRIIESSHSPDDETRARVRRSIASAIAPPYSPNTISGTSEQSPTSPTANVECDSAYTWIDTVTAVICCPSCDTVDPTHNRRKSGDSFSGRRSVSSGTLTTYVTT